MNECNEKIFPKIDYESNLLIVSKIVTRGVRPDFFNFINCLSFFKLLHNVEDIAAPYDKSTILRQTTTDGSLTIELLLALTTAEMEVRKLPIAYRKCRYRDENNLNYFGVSCRSIIRSLYLILLFQN